MRLRPEPLFKRLYRLGILLVKPSGLEPGPRSGGCVEKHKVCVKAIVLLDPGKWGIVVDYVLEENKLIGKEVLIDYDDMQDLNETRDGFLMIETLEVPMIKRGDTIEITIRNRTRK